MLQSKLGEQTTYRVEKDKRVRPRGDPPMGGSTHPRPRTIHNVVQTPHKTRLGLGRRISMLGPTVMREKEVGVSFVGRV